MAEEGNLLATLLNGKNLLDAVPRYIEPVGTAPYEEIKWAELDLGGRAGVPERFQSERIETSAKARNAIEKLSKTHHVSYEPLPVDVTLKGERNGFLADMRPDGTLDQDAVARRLARWSQKGTVTVTNGYLARILAPSLFTIDPLVMTEAEKSWAANLLPVSVSARLHRLIILGDEADRTVGYVSDPPEGAIGSMYLILGGNTEVWSAWSGKGLMTRYPAGTTGSWAIGTSEQPVSVTMLRDKRRKDSLCACLILALYAKSEPDPALDRCLLALSPPFGLLLPSSAEHKKMDVYSAMIKRRARQLFETQMEEFPVLFSLFHSVDGIQDGYFAETKVYPLDAVTLKKVQSALEDSNQVSWTYARQKENIGAVKFYALQPCRGTHWTCTISARGNPFSSRSELFFFDALLIRNDNSRLLGKRRESPSSTA
ncbi:unnamed protein product [Sympodiomycopsis kandeliae]